MHYLDNDRTHKTLGTVPDFFFLLLAGYRMWGFIKINTKRERERESEIEVR